MILERDVVIEVRRDGTLLRRGYVKCDTRPDIYRRGSRQTGEAVEMQPEGAADPVPAGWRRKSLTTVADPLNPHIYTVEWVDEQDAPGCLESYQNDRS